MTLAGGTAAVLTAAVSPRDPRRDADAVDLIQLAEAHNLPVVQANDLPRAIRDARRGRVEFRLDRTGIIHVPIGKVSFTNEQLVENLSALVDAIQKAKPSGAKGQYFRSITLTTTMGPGIELDLQPTLALATSQ